MIEARDHLPEIDVGQGVMTGRNRPLSATATAMNGDRPVGADGVVILQTRTTGIRKVAYKLIEDLSRCVGKDLSPDCR
jgi:hypothetical protein